MMTLGIDTGGTFTDFVLLKEGRLQVHKVLSTPESPEKAILQGIDELGLMPAAKQGQLLITHGSTVATNAALEGKGVKTAFITNRGFADLLTIGRQARKHLYDLQPPLQPVPVPVDLCLETGGRLSAEGALLDPLTDTDIETIIAQLAELKPDAIAINFLFSFLDPTQEKRLAQALADHYYVSRSSAVLPIAGEYERGIATWLNASLGPLVKAYIQRLDKAFRPSPLAIMQSTGGTIDAQQASDHAVSLLLSGPAGGLAGARFIGQNSHISHLLTFDMGGTSTDVATIDDGIRLTSEGHIGDWPVAIPMVDMHTIGAGGGSLAWLDKGGLLQVGPESAGASPGPACYGQGGKQPTVTDANAVLGRLRPENFLGGQMQLDVNAARSAMQPLASALNISIEAVAEGIIAITNEHMVNALRVISVQRGYDLDVFRLCCFGGAGGLHICALANLLQIKKALVPLHGGVLSALGMLVAIKERQLSQSLTGLLKDHSADSLQQALSTLQQQGLEELYQEGIHADSIETAFSVDLRYQGQRFYLNVNWQQDIDQAISQFHSLHQARYGHALKAPIELVHIRAALHSKQQPIELADVTCSQPGIPSHVITLWGIEKECPVFPRDKLASGQQIQGPALITEKVSTTLIGENWMAEIDKVGNILLDRVASG